MNHSQDLSLNHPRVNVYENERKTKILLEFDYLYEIINNSDTNAQHQYLITPIGQTRIRYEDILRIDKQWYHSAKYFLTHQHVQNRRDFNGLDSSIDVGVRIVTQNKDYFFITGGGTAPETIRKWFDGLEHGPVSGVVTSPVPETVYEHLNALEHGPVSIAVIPPVPETIYEPDLR